MSWRIQQVGDNQRVVETMLLDKPEAIRCLQRAEELRRTDDPYLVRLADKIERCPIDVWVNEWGNPIYAPRRCRSRLCPMCSAERSRKVRWRLRSKVKRMKEPAFLTLCMGSESATDLKATITLLTRTFRKLRGRKIWSRNVLGAIATLEVKPNDKAPGWWTHLHVVLDAPAVTKRGRARLLAQWRELVGTRRASAHFDAGIPKGEELHVFGYVLKDGGRCPRPGDLTNTQLREFARGMFRVRSMMTYGSCRLVPPSQRRGTRHDEWERIEFGAPRRLRKRNRLPIRTAVR